MVDFQTLEPFVPSGPDMAASRQLFEALGFTVRWDGGDYVGYERGGCRFILQNFDNREFAENLMISVRLNDVNAFWKELQDAEITQRFSVAMRKPVQQPYGLEVNLIDLAGVCWHFISE